MLYTIMPPEMTANPQFQSKTELYTVKGVVIEGEKTSDGIRISRIVSTDPKTFLNSFFAPGNVIKLR